MIVDVTTLPISIMLGRFLSWAASIMTERFPSLAVPVMAGRFLSQGVAKVDTKIFFDVSSCLFFHSTWYHTQWTP